MDAQVTAAFSGLPVNARAARFPRKAAAARSSHSRDPLRKNCLPPDHATGNIIGTQFRGEAWMRCGDYENTGSFWQLVGSVRRDVGAIPAGSV